MCLFDKFIYCNMLAVVEIFSTSITLQNYSTKLFSIFIVLCIRSLFRLGSLSEENIPILSDI